MRTGLYVHIPFCRVRCPYCSFNVYAGIADRIPDYLRAVPQELALRTQAIRPSVDTIYLGGGTPSLLTAAQVGELLHALSTHVDLADDAEVTLEIDPGTADLARLKGFRAAGVTRVTVGVQTFQPRLLRALGRAHTVVETVSTLRDVVDAGFTDLNIDLMFGLPEQTLAAFETDLDTALAAGPTHLSLYNLTLEPHTGFARRANAGTLPLPSEDLQASMYQAAVERTRAAGLPRYEISNFARPGRRSRHNQKHWFGASYIGIGAGAHGFDADARERWWNVKSPRRWMRSVATGVRPESGRERLDDAEELAEAVLLGLRTVEGLDRDRFRRRFGVDPGADLDWAGPPSNEEEHTVVVDRTHVRLTDRGFRLADHLAERLLGRLDPPSAGG